VTPKQLADVRAASKRERAHYGLNERFGCPFHCACGSCVDDREIMAEAMPALLRYIDDAMSVPRREHHDLGDLD